MPNTCPFSSLLFVIAYHGTIFAEEMFGSCAAVVASTSNIFKANFMFAFAMVNVGALLIRTHSLIMDRWEMKFWERRYRKVLPAAYVLPAGYVVAFVVVAYTIGLSILVVNWPYIALGAVLALALVILLWLGGHAYLQNSLERLRMKKKFVVVV